MFQRYVLPPSSGMNKPSDRRFESVDNHFTRQYNPEDSSEHHTRRRENLKSHNTTEAWKFKKKQSSPATRHGGAWGERRYSSYSLLTSALDGMNGQRHAPTGICPEERTPGTHCTEGWVGPRAGLDTELRGKILNLCRGSNLDRPVVQSVVRHYTDWATPALKIFREPEFLVSEHSTATRSNQQRAWTMPWLRLVAGLSTRRPGFALGSVHVRFVVDKAALGQVRVLRFSPPSMIPRWFSMLIYYLGDEQ
jgi:hypothetical protein